MGRADGGDGIEEFMEPECRRNNRSDMRPRHRACEHRLEGLDCVTASLLSLGEQSKHHPRCHPEPMAFEYLSRDLPERGLHVEQSSADRPWSPGITGRGEGFQRLPTTERLSAIQVPNQLEVALLGELRGSYWRVLTHVLTAVFVAPPCCVTRGRHRTLSAPLLNASSLALLDQT